MTDYTDTPEHRPSVAAMQPGDTITTATGAIIECISIEEAWSGPFCPCCGDIVEGIGSDDLPMVCKSGCGAFTEAQCGDTDDTETMPAAPSEAWEARQPVDECSEIKINGPLMVAELQAILARYADDDQVLLGNGEGDYYNVGAILLPAVDRQNRSTWEAVTLELTDTFDPRQF